MTCLPEMAEIPKQLAARLKGSFLDRRCQISQLEQIFLRLALFSSKYINAEVLSSLEFLKCPIKSIFQIALYLYCPCCPQSYCSGGTDWGQEVQSMDGSNQPFLWDGTAH